MDLPAHFRLLARYNRIANQRVFEVCAGLELPEYRKPRHGSFGSIEGILNHLLLGDRIWMARFQGGGHQTPPLDAILFPEFSGLREARTELDAQIEDFFRQLGICGPGAGRDQPLFQSPDPSSRAGSRAAEPDSGASAVS